MIRVADNGCGIAIEELPLAVASHATSKIRSADDLFSVMTLGFRGEALASIAEVSRLVVRSRTADAESGAELEVVGGAASAMSTDRLPGRDDDRSSQFVFQYAGAAQVHAVAADGDGAFDRGGDAASARASAHSFHARAQWTNGARSAAGGECPRRIAAFFGDELADDLIEVGSESDGVSLSGFVANPMHSRATGRMQYLFLNGRAIRDRALQHALGEAYRGLLLTGRQPICFLRLEMPADLGGCECASDEAGSPLSGFGAIVQFAARHAADEVFDDRSAGARGDADGELAVAVSMPASGGSDASELVSLGKGAVGTADCADKLDAPIGFGHESMRVTRRGLRRIASRCDYIGSTRRRCVPFDIGRPPAEPGADRRRASTQIMVDASSRRSGRLHRSYLDAPSNALQVHNRYLVVETDAGIEVIDQHALHERILYEQIREKVLSGSLESQKLLVPEPVDLTATEAAAALEHADVLAQLGVEIQPFGGETVLVSSYPAMLANLSPADVLRELVEKLLAGGRQPEARDLVDELLHMIACKAAVKFGDRLTPEEVDALLSQRHLAQDQHHCPHGRPTALVFTREDLDRQFKRI